MPMDNEKNNFVCGEHCRKESKSDSNGVQNGDQQFLFIPMFLPTVHETLVAYQTYGEV
jgi:hypothetical protein